jgi:hypothetical protein
MKVEESPTVAEADRASVRDVALDKEANEHGELDPAIDKRLDRKFDLHILPFLFGIW